MGWEAPLLVAAGGAAGSLARWGVGLLAAGCGPWPTLAINAAGSLLIGALAGWAGKPAWAGPLLMTGLCGGFTTFSAYSLHTLELWQADRPGAAAGYAAGTVAASFVAVAAGWWLARRFTG